MSTSDQLAARRAYNRAQSRLFHENHGGKTGAIGYPFVPVELILPLIEPVIAEQGLRQLAQESKLGLKGLYDIRTGKRRQLRFDTADRLISVVLGRPELWWENAELRAIYEQR
jgi:hypothetical protein